MCVVAGNAVGDEPQEKQKGKGGRKTPSATQRFVEKIELTDEQKSKVAEIDKQFAEKLKDVAKARTEILTPEQIKAEAAAKKEAKAAGKSGADAKAAVDAALALTDEQKARLKVWMKTQNELNAAVIAELRKVLTPEQQESLPKQRAKGKKKDAEAK